MGTQLVLGHVGVPQLGHDAVGIARIARETGLGRQTVYRIKER